VALLAGTTGGVTSARAQGAPDPAAPRERPAAAPAPTDKPGGREVALPLFREGKELFDTGYYLQALEKFKLALFHFPNPRIHTNIALCYKWLGQNLKALEHYELFLQQVPKDTTDATNAALRKQIEEVEVKALLRMVRSVRITMTEPPGAEIRVNGALAGLSPMDKVIRMNPGDVNITVILKGYYAFRKDLNLYTEPSAHVKVALVKIMPRVIKIKEKAVPIHKRWWFWTAIGVAVAGSTAGVLAKYGEIKRPRDLVGTPIYTDGFPVRW
jgi:tetratricopeptide (TPR) repeat protein